MSQQLIFNYSIATAKGTRPINEDASWVGFNKTGQGLAIVCDGIGSQDDSQIASLITVDVFRHQFEKKSHIRNVEHFYNKCMKNAFSQITQRAIEKLNGKKIGTTVLVAFTDDKEVTVFNLGDTRLYHYSLNDSSWAQITRDHNLYNHFIELSEKDKNINIGELCLQHKTQLLALTKCLESGGNSHLKFTKYNIRVDVGDVIFLATDGVYHYIRLDDVNNIMKNNTKNFETVSKNIVQLALDNKSNDNLTAIILECINADARG